MKKVKTAAALLCSACLVLSGTAVPTMTDSVKVVTLGADLTQDQKNTMMKYFNVDSNQVQILTITNQDERDHLSAYVPLEQIGTRTVSCAYVKPTQSGGIKVRTANLNWVTCNMIATSLSTSGVKNCEVVAACPFEVSGTGALTGIQMAYETATGEQLDSTKKELATEEMVVTGNLADEGGKNDATTVMNNSKIQVIKDNVQNVDDIYNIVVNVAQQNNVNLDSDQINKIVELLKQIAQQEYNYDDVKATLEQVEQNTSGDNDELGDIDDEEDDTVNAGDPADGDDILNNVDNSALGGDIVESSTENPSLEEDSGLIEDDGDDQSDGDLSETEEPQEPDGDETTDDSTLGNTDEGDTDSDEGTDDTENDTTSDELDTSALTEDQKTMFDKAENFCKGEYEGDTTALTTAMEDETATASVTLDAENGATLAKNVEKAYLKILTEGTASYQADGTEIYMSTELNMVQRMQIPQRLQAARKMQNNQGIMQISENKDGSAKVLFRIRKAEMADVDEIMAVMHEAKNDKEHPDWFVSDDEEYVRTHIEEQGFVIVAQTADGSVAGFFLIKYPENREDNLGTYLDFDEEQLSHVAVMDSAVVCCAYRGNGLQGHMLEEAERLLDTDQYYYLMFTIHPDNQFSRHNMEIHGYEVKRTALCYGGLPRCILLKDLTESGKSPAQVVKSSKQ